MSVSASPHPPLPRLPFHRRRDPTHPISPAVVSPTADATAGRQGSALRRVPIHALRPNPDQPRRRFDPDALDQLAATIEQDGPLSPPVVREDPDAPGRYILLAGERRWRACCRREMTEIEVLVRDCAQEEMLTLALIENVARADLTPIEEAQAFRDLLARGEFSQAGLARRFGRSESSLSKTLKLLELPDAARDLIDQGRLTKRHGVALAAEQDPARQRALARAAVRDGWTVRQLEARIKRGDEPQTGRSIPADQRAFAEALQDALDRRTGCEWRVESRRTGFLIGIRVDGPQDARTIAERLGADVRALDEL